MRVTRIRLATATAILLATVVLAWPTQGESGPRRLFLPLTLRNYPVQRLAFLRSYREGSPLYWDLYLINADGSGETRLASLGKEMYYNPPPPAWSPDGSKLAFVSYDLQDVCTINADGSGRTNVTRNSAGNRDPVWSPDGRRLAFTGGTESGGTEVLTTNADGTDRRRLTNNALAEYNPSWSPDGRKVAFSRPDGT